MKVGITGHQERPGLDWSWVESTLESEFDGRQLEAVYSSLAVGSDQLFVSVAIRHAVPVIGVLPFEDYQRTFDARQKDDYFNLRGQCKKLIILDWPGDDEVAFLKAGKYIVTAADLMFAIWDGKQAAGVGGTADVVKFARDRGKPVLHINPLEKSTRLLSS